MTATSTSIVAKRGQTAPSPAKFPGYVESRIVSGIAGVLRELGASVKVLDAGNGTASLAERLSDEGVTLVPSTLGATPRVKRVDAALFLDSLTGEREAAKPVAAILKAVRPGGMVLRGTIESEDPREARAYEAIAAIAKDAGAELPSRRGDINGFVNTVESAGAWLEVLELGRWTGTASGRAVLDHWSANLPADASERAREAVQEIFGDLDATTDAERSFSLMVARLP